MLESRPATRRAARGSHDVPLVEQSPHSVPRESDNPSEAGRPGFRRSERALREPNPCNQYRLISIHGQIDLYQPPFSARSRREKPEGRGEQRRSFPTLARGLRAAAASCSRRYPSRADGLRSNGFAVKARAIAGDNEARPVIGVLPLWIRQHAERDLSHGLAPAIALLQPLVVSHHQLTRSIIADRPQTHHLRLSA